MSCAQLTTSSDDTDTDGLPIIDRRVRRTAPGPKPRVPFVTRVHSVLSTIAYEEPNMVRNLSESGTVTGDELHVSPERGRAQRSELRAWGCFSAPSPVIDSPRHNA